MTFSGSVSSPVPIRNHEDLTESSRRDYQRLKLQLPAELMTLDGPEPVLLLDLSQVGARLACRSSPTFKKGILSWMNFESYGETVWEKENMCGLRFEEELDLEILLKTRRGAPMEWKRQSDDIVAAAKKWAQGR